MPLGWVSQQPKTHKSQDNYNQRISWVDHHKIQILIQLNIFGTILGKGLKQRKPSYKTTFSHKLRKPGTSLWTSQKANQLSTDS